MSARRGFRFFRAAFYAASALALICAPPHAEGEGAWEHHPNPRNIVQRKVIYLTPDKKFRAAVIYYKPRFYGVGESRVDIQTARGKLLASHDYTDRGTQGFFVDKAAWTADSRFFVFSLTSSGGHGPWCSPTHFFDRHTNRYYYLDALVSAVTDANFSLAPPSRVTVKDRENQKRKFALDKLSSEQRTSAQQKEESAQRARGGD